MGEYPTFFIFIKVKVLNSNIDVRNLLSPRSALGIFLYVNVISWLLLLGINLISFLGFGNQELPSFSINLYLKGLLINFFFLIIFFYFRAQTEYLKTLDFIEILTNLFITGLITTTLSLILQFISTNLELPPVDEVKANWMNILYHLNIGLVSIFLTQTFFYWKQMILHQKSSGLVKLWRTFEYILLASLLFNFFEQSLADASFVVALVILLIIGLVLSVNLKWIAYLNAKEKWQGILLLIFISSFTFLFFRTVIVHSYNPHLTTDLTHSVYILAIGAFVLFYSLFAVLVILFNLPTTSVMESKIEEVMSFQRLAQVLQTEENEDKVYELLLESAGNNVEADAAWLDIFDEDGNVETTLCQDIDKETVSKLKQIIKKNKLRQILNNTFSRNHDNDKLLSEMREWEFESIYTVPLMGYEKPIGSITLLKKVEDGFHLDKQEVLNTFVMQASVAIENIRLLEKTIEAERYKEEIEIAQKIQKKLLPANISVQGLDIDAFSFSAYEVGGDYYDIFKIDEQRVLLIVGDVSGKGTTAAFNMAQVKGVFQGIALLKSQPKDFLKYANQALSACFDKSSFITATLLYINTESQTLTFSRAGHCPTLYYSHQTEETTYLQDKGMALAVFRKPQYEDFLEVTEIQYQANDIVLLYTDGIVEARDKQGEEYGYERFQNIIRSNTKSTATEINQRIIKSVENFSEGTNNHDDFTALTIKFSEN